MPLTEKNCTAVILAGGQSRRMGCCKALLKLGEQTLLSRLAGELSGFRELLLSSNDPTLAGGLKVRLVQDVYKDCGPLGGLHAALRSSEGTALFCLPCDLPLFTAAAARTILAQYRAEYDAMVCRDGAGGLHPLCGVYSPRVLPALERQLASGNYRVRALLEQVRCRYLDTGALLPDEVFCNLNTPQDVEALTAGFKT